MVCCLAVLVVATAGASGTYDLTGTWSLNGPTPLGPDQTWLITSMDDATGTFSGTGGSNGSDDYSVTGTESGTAVTVTNTYGSSGYVATFVGSLSVNAAVLTITGTWSDTNGFKNEPFTATVASKRASATEVSCNLFDPDQPTAYFDCTATVADASGAETPGTPTGTVTFSINPGGGGGLVSNMCTLTPSQSGPTSFCDVHYVPPAGGILIGSQPPISATYSGDSTFAGSSGSPQTIIVTTAESSTESSMTETTETTSTSETTSTETTTTEYCWVLDGSTARRRPRPSTTRLPRRRRRELPPTRHRLRRRAPAQATRHPISREDQHLPARSSPRRR